MSTLERTHYVRVREARSGWRVSYVGRSGREHPYKRHMGEDYARAYAVALGRLLDCPIDDSRVVGEGSKP